MPWWCAAPAKPVSINNMVVVVVVVEVVVVMVVVVVVVVVVMAEVVTVWQHPSACTAPSLPGIVLQYMFSPQTFWHGATKLL